MKKLIALPNGTERHGRGCKCGLCDLNGKSYCYKVIAYDEKLDDLLETCEDEFHDTLAEEEPIDVFYAPSEEGAEKEANMFIEYLRARGEFI